MSFGNALGAFATGFAGTYGDRKERERKELQLPNVIVDNFGTGTGGAAVGTPLIPEGMPGGLGVTGAGEPVSSDGTLLSLLDKVEGGGSYDTLFGHSQNGGRFDGVKVSDMTLAQLYDFSNPNGDYGQWVKSHVGRVATPMGRAQIVGRTLRNAAKELGLSDDTKFTPQLQDTIGAHLAKGRLTSATSPAAKRAALRAEWEGLSRISDDALDAAIAKFEADGYLFRPRALGVGPT